MSTTTDPARPVPPPGDLAPSAPTPVSRRALAPDLARGMMLLFIALAHVPWFLFDAEVGVTLLHPADGTVADRIAQIVTITTVDARAYPLFALLFAYGIGQLYTGRSRAAPPSATRGACCASATCGSWSSVCCTPRSCGRATSWARTG